jgi:hypothetical protein
MKAANIAAAAANVKTRSAFIGRPLQSRYDDPVKGRIDGPGASLRLAPISIGKRRTEDLPAQPEVKVSEGGYGTHAMLKHCSASLLPLARLPPPSPTPAIAQIPQDALRSATLPVRDVLAASTKMPFDLLSLAVFSSTTFRPKWVAEAPLM